MFKTLLKFIVSGCMLILPALSHAQVGAVTGDLGTDCSATGAVMAADGACTFTPTTYKIQIFEMYENTIKSNCFLCPTTYRCWGQFCFGVIVCF